jgi:hypothetical protein
MAERPESAKSGLAPMRRPNGGTEATLPNAEIDHLSRLGPKLPVAMKRLWLEIEGADRHQLSHPPSSEPGKSKAIQVDA